MEAALTGAGYEVFPVQLDFLAEFGGLRIVISETTVIRFDVTDLIGPFVGRCQDEGLDSENMERLGIHWSFVGLIRSNDLKPRMAEGDMILMITGSGLLYCVGEGFESVIGQAGEDALDNLCKGLWNSRVQRQDWIFQPAPGYPRKHGQYPK
jgi:hypothetical protein